MATLSMIWSKLVQIVSMINFPVDILDILLVTVLVYQLFRLSTTQAARQIVKAIVLLLVISVVSNFIGLNVINYLIDRIIEVGMIALVVVFQPELRRLLERVGGSSLKNILVPKSQNADEKNSKNMVDAIVSACRTMSREKIGVLIVFQRKSSLDEFFKTGTVVDAAISAELLKNIFFPKAALHDGAVIIRDKRIAAAGCVLPLTDNADLSRDLGTRHRAAIGVTEHTDALVVVVSEETGVISCASGGKLKRYLTPESLTKLLNQEFLEENTREPIHHRVINKISGKVGKKTDRNEGSDHDET